MVREGVRIGLWIDGERMREQDLALAGDLRELGAEVLLVGQQLPDDAAPGAESAEDFATLAVRTGDHAIQLAAERGFAPELRGL